MNADASPHHQFPNTAWTRIKFLQDSVATEEQKLSVLNYLGTYYWLPLYHYARRAGRSPEEAQDLTQGFFEMALQKELFSLARRESGRLRNFLLTSFTNYMRTAHQRASALKRGGGREHVTLDAAEADYSLTMCTASPELAYEVAVAQNLLNGALSAVQSNFKKRGKMREYDSLKKYLGTQGEAGAYEAEAATLRVTEGYYRQMVIRFRKRFKTELTQLVEDMLPEGTSLAEIEAEVREMVRLAYTS